MESILDPRPTSRRLRPTVNWGLVAAALTIIGWLLAAGEGAFGDYRKIGDRVTTLETQRSEDVRKSREQREEDSRWRERMENKIDVLLQRGR
jgi:hypothetical protein